MTINAVKVMFLVPGSELMQKSLIYRKAVSALPPAGLAYMAAYLEKAGHKAVIVDQFAANMTNEKLIERIKTEAPRIVGISCLTSAMSNVREIVKGIRKLSGDIIIVLGNTHATIFAEELLLDGAADAVVRGEGEYAMAELADAVSRGESFRGIPGVSYTAEDGRVINNPEREPVDDLEALPYPAWHLVDMRYYTRYALLGLYGNVILPVQGSRGCPFRCFFCAQDKVHKHPRYRGVKQIIDEMEYMHRKYGAAYFGFNDASFPFSVKQGLEFCNEFIRRGLNRKIRWITETRVDLISTELLSRMKEAGLSLVMFGFESGNQEILDSIGKEADLDQARNAMAICRKLGIRTLGLFILGLPGETRKTCEETISFAKELKCDIVKFNIAVPLPGSRFYEHVKGRYSDTDSPEKFSSWQDWSSHGGRSVYVPDGMSSSELVNLQRKAMFTFYMRPSMIFKHILSGTYTLSDICLGGFVLFKNYSKIFSEIFIGRRV